MKNAFAAEHPDAPRSFNDEATLHKAERDVKLVPSQRGADKHRPAEHRHTRAPQREVKRGEETLVPLFPEGSNPLTVGDLSVVSAQRKRRRKDGGDGFDDACLDLGLESVYVGPRPSDVQPSTSQSQEIDGVRLLKQKRLIKKRFLMKNPSILDAETEQMVFKK